jgi:hypothetical protein
VTVHSDTATGALQDRPMADAGLTSYRYPSRYGGYIMIGATDADDALREAKRSMSELGEHAGVGEAGNLERGD